MGALPTPKIAANQDVQSFNDYALNQIRNTPAIVRGPAYNPEQNRTRLSALAQIPDYEPDRYEKIGKMDMADQINAMMVEGMKNRAIAGRSDAVSKSGLPTLENTITAHEIEQPNVAYRDDVTQQHNRQSALGSAFTNTMKEDLRNPTVVSALNYQDALGQNALSQIPLHQAQAEHAKKQTEAIVPKDVQIEAANAERERQSLERLFASTTYREHPELRDELESKVRMNPKTEEWQPGVPAIPEEKGHVFGLFGSKPAIPAIPGKVVQKSLASYPGAKVAPDGHQYIERNGQFFRVQ